MRKSKSTQKKKILFIINSLKYGGAERNFYEDANRLNKKGHQVYFAILFGSSKEQPLLSKLELPKERVIFCNAKKFYDFELIKKLRKYVQENKIDILYSTLNEANIVSRTVKILLPVECVIREANIATYKSWKFKTLDIFLNFFAKKIIAVSGEVASSLEKYQPWVKSKIVVLLNGVEIPKVSRKYSVNKPDKITFLNIGSLTPKKGQKYLIEAAKIVYEKRPNDFILNIIGSGSEEEILRKMIHDYKLENIIKILPPVSREEISNYYLNSDVFILSSLWEGCPNVLLEAMAHGLTVISTEVSGAKEAIEDDVSGILVLPKNRESLAQGMFAVIHYWSMMGDYGIEARKRMIENFSMDHHNDILESILIYL